MKKFLGLTLLAAAMTGNTVLAAPLEGRIGASVTRVLRLRDEMAALERERPALESALAREPKGSQAAVRLTRLGKVEARLKIVVPAIEQEEMQLMSLLGERQWPDLIVVFPGTVKVVFNTAKEVNFGTPADKETGKPGASQEAAEYSVVKTADGKTVVMLTTRSTLRFNTVKPAKGGGRNNEGGGKDEGTYTITKNNLGQTVLTFNSVTPVTISNTPETVEKGKQQESETVTGATAIPEGGKTKEESYSVTKLADGTQILTLNFGKDVKFSAKEESFTDEVGKKPEKSEDGSSAPPVIAVPENAGDAQDNGSVTKLADGTQILSMKFNKDIDFAAKEESFTDEVGKKPEEVDNSGAPPPVIAVPETPAPAELAKPREPQTLTLNFSRDLSFTAEEKAVLAVPLVLSLDSFELTQGGVAAVEKTVQGQKALALKREQPGWLSMRVSVKAQQQGATAPEGLSLKVTPFPSNCDGLIAPGTDMGAGFSGGRAGVETGTEGVKEFPAVVSQCLFRFAVLTESGDRAEVASMTWRSPSGTKPLEGQILPLSVALDAAPAAPAPVAAAPVGQTRQAKRLAVGDSDTATVTLEGYTDYVFDLVTDNRPYDLEVSAASGTVAAFGLIGGEALPSRDSALISSGDVASGASKTLRFSKSEAGSPTVAGRIAVHGRSAGGNEPIRFTVSLKSVDKNIAAQGLGGSATTELKVLSINPATAAPGDLVSLQVEGASPDEGSMMVLFQGAAEINPESSNLFGKPQTVAARVPQGAQTGQVKVRSAGALSETGAYLTVGGLAAPVAAAPSGCTGGNPAFSAPVLELSKTELQGNELDSTTATVSMTGTASALPGGMSYTVTADKGFLFAAGAAEAPAGQPLTVTANNGQASFTYRSPFLSAQDASLVAAGGSTAKITVQAVLPGQDAEGCRAEKTITLTLPAPPGAPETGP